MKKRLIIFSAGLLALTGCVKQEEVDLLQKELIQIKKELSEIKEDQNRIKEDISLLSKRVDNVSKVASQNSLEIQKIKSFGEIKPEKGKSEEIEREGEEKVKFPEKPEDLYKYGLDAYYKGKIEEAREAFSLFVKKFRDSELYDNALFWLGQTYYTEGRYDTALKIFSRLVNECMTGQISDCNKLPTAMLKEGYSLMKLGEVDKAKEVFKKILKEFPDTEEAEIAQKKLEVME
ncbi:tol-pal system protein YbgF [Persephonella hydrogeniphila]|uniref:Tol-pal system protein YbgF n=1 Tax=Persephonella hydrogeniphila TaxID=198703 RepID=A0A285NGS2_9AQUI|nr:tetratricopeptide repeat protein [Persephonella hydrogeniphila]SNZ07086.1 tol-pal system protein YbgF [Persephonella hydrogeniphila]